MARTRLNPRLAKLHYSYTVEEVGRLFSVHRNSVRQWLKTGGLAAIDSQRPTLIKGATLRAFIESRRASAKRPCPPGTLYCLKCRAPRGPALGMADFMAQETGAGDLRALCETCGTAMHRRTRQSAIPDILPDIDVRMVRAAPRIVWCPRPSLNCDLKTDGTT